MYLQFLRRRSVQKLQSSRQDGLKTLYSGEMLRESAVKLAKEMSCQMQGMTKRKLLCPEMTRRAYRPLSRRLDRCDRVIQDEVGDSNGGNV